MNKPLTIVADEFQRDLINSINSYSLPMFVVESILKEIINEVHIAAAKQLESDRAIYEKELMKTKSSEVKA